MQQDRNITYTQQTTGRYTLENSIVLSFNNGLDCNKICHEIQNLINRYTGSGKVVDNSFLIINIANVSCTIEPELPKIPYIENVDNSRELIR